MNGETVRRGFAGFRPVRTAAEARRRRLLGITAVAAAGALFGVLITVGLATNPILFLFPLAVLGLLVIWTLPQSDSAPTRALGWLFLAFLGAMLFWPDYLAIALPGLPWITLRRIVAFPMAFLFLISLSISATFRREIAEVFEGNRAVVRLFLIFIFIQLLSIGWSTSPVFSMSKFVLSQLYFTMIFVVGCWFFRRPGSVEKWVLLLLIPLVPLSIVGILESGREQVLWAQSIPSFLRIEDPSVMRTLAGGARAGTEVYRVQTIFGTALGYAEYIGLATPFLIHVVVTSYRFWLRAISAILIPLSLYMAILTDSRLGVIGFFSSFICYGLGWSLRRWLQVRHSVIGPLFTLAYPAAVAAFFAATLVIGRLRRAVWGGGETEGSTEARAEQYSQGIDLLMGRPWGFGIGRGAESLGFSNGAGTLTIDTYYMLVALDYGVIGFFVFYSMLLISVWSGGFGYLRTAAHKREHLMLLPLTVSLTNFIIVKSVFSEVENHPIAFMTMAAISALLWRQRVGSDVTDETEARTAIPGARGGFLPPPPSLALRR